MKLQKLTEKRWFWPALCAVSVVFGWWYLSITTCAPLGGDDELINLQNYYYITHTSFGQSVLDYLGDLWVQFTLQNGRFRPFSSPPVRGLTSWFLGDLVGYRLYILAWTYADIVLTAWLVGKASRSKKLGIACLCLLPMMFSVWQDSTGNSLYSYGALVQSTLLPALVAGLAVLRWQDTGHKRWAVLAGYCAFQCCATFEIGFTYIVPIFGLAWLYTDKARDALRLTVPVFLGECVTLAFNMGARLANTLRAAGILAGDVQGIDGISPNFDIPALLRTWLMQMSAGFPLNAMLAGRVRPGQHPSGGCPLRRYGRRSRRGRAGRTGYAAEQKAEPFAVPYRPCHALRPGAADRTFAQIPAARSGGLAAWLHPPDGRKLRRRPDGAGCAGRTAALGVRQGMVAKAPHCAVCFAGCLHGWLGRLAARRDPLGL